MSPPQPANGPSYRRLIIVTVLLAIPGIAVLRPIGPGAWWPTPDLWWHLRTARWIVEHGALPFTDPFSAFGMGRPWVAYSWAFELLMYRLYLAWGLMGVMAYTLVVSLAVGVSLFALVRGLLPHFAGSVVITAVGFAALVPVLSPRPWLITILFFFVELHVLLMARRSGNTRLLWLLPPIFVLWANVHIQFVYGLGLLVLAALEPALEPIVRRTGLDSEASPIPATRMLLVFGGCALATLVGPYHVHVYRVILELITQSGVFQSINELVAMQFRDPSDWVTLGLTVAAAFALGRRRTIQVFPMLLLLAGAALAFRARRDAWFLVGATCAILASSLTRLPSETRVAITKLRGSMVAIGVALIIATVALVRGTSERQLRSVMARRYPVHAAAFVDERGYSGPLYNHFNWGGYLMWRLPDYPVSMDGRTNVHLPERVDRSLATWSGAGDWATDPELAAAHLVIASVHVPLTALLASDSRFRLAYRDGVAAVFVAADPVRPVTAAKPGGGR